MRPETPTLRRFDDDQYFTPRDPLMRIFGSPGSLAVQRHKGIGPPYFKIGRRVLYRGSDLNAALDAARVEPAAA